MMLGVCTIGKYKKLVPYMSERPVGSGWVAKIKITRNLMKIVRNDPLLGWVHPVGGKKLKMLKNR